MQYLWRLGLIRVSGIRLFYLHQFWLTTSGIVYELESVYFIQSLYNNSVHVNVI